ncbi:MAG TPA: hypothetical protein PKY87_13630 [Terricaulis sp.]|nr:hypothetical protein [Terricaulis sp.]
MKPVLAGLFAAMSAAEHLPFCFDAMADNDAAAMATAGRNLRNRAFKRVEGPGFTAALQRESLVVIVSALVAASHLTSRW